jgi:hypothetical protein
MSRKNVFSIGKESLNSDGNQFHQYQQNMNVNLNQTKKTNLCDIFVLLLQKRKIRLKGDFLYKKSKSRSLYVSMIVDAKNV